jgi:energy-coupling factor transporter ATP-binding protein EcfA2
MYELSPFHFSYRTCGKTKKIFSESPIVFGAHDSLLITGPSGGGKSTFLQLLKGIIPQFVAGKLEGQIYFKGKPLHGEIFDHNLKKIIYLFQNPFTQTIYPYAEEEFFFSMENFNFSHDEMTAQKEKFEKLFNLDSLWGRKTSELSNGECQKLVLASLLAINPEVLLLDEPTAFLDPEARIEFYQLLSEFKNDRMLAIVDHHVKEVLPFVNRIIHVNEDGKITELNKSEFNIQKINAELSLKLPAAESNLTEVNLKNINFSYGERAVFSDLNASFKKNEIVVIKGRNGAGKSTLFKMIATVLKPQKGEVTAKSGDRIIKGKELFKEVAFIFQNPESHFLFDTIEEELKQVAQKNFPENDKNILLESFFHELNQKKSPFLLSEGEKRRLSLILALFQGKSLFLFDEPTFGQDAKSKQLIASLMKTIKNYGALQIVISHDEEFIESVADKVFLLEGGKLK